MKIIAVGWNYCRHNEEMGLLQVPDVPTLFMKPDSALLRDGKPFFLPDHLGRIEYEAELVVRVCRLGKNIAPRFASRYYDAATVGIDFTARELQHSLRASGSPWEIAKGFDGAAVLGEFISLDEIRGTNDASIGFSLSINGEERQATTSDLMIHPIDQLIAYISRFFTLKIGDLIYTGTPAGVGEVVIGDHYEGFLSERKVLDFYIR